MRLTPKPRQVLLAALAGMLVLLLAPDPVWAQASKAPPENPATKKGHPLDPADVATLTGRPQPARPPAARPKAGHPLDAADVFVLTGNVPPSTAWPKLGHPLDPVDVEILSAGTNEATPEEVEQHPLAPVFYSRAGYYLYGIDPRFGRRSVFTAAATVVGVVNNRPFVLVGTTTSARPSLFILAPGKRRTPTVILVP